MTFSIMLNYAGCRYAECRYARHSARLQASKTDFKQGQNFYLLKPIEQNLLDTYAGK